MSELLDTFTRASKVMRAAMESAMRRHGLHLGQNLVLAALWEQDGRTPGSIATALGVTTPTVVKMATRMTATGLLTRRRDDLDHRLVRLYLTDAGRELRGPVEEELSRIEAHVSSALTDAEYRHLLVALDKITHCAGTLLPEPVDDTVSA